MAPTIHVRLTCIASFVICCRSLYLQGIESDRSESVDGEVGFVSDDEPAAREPKDSSEEELAQSSGPKEAGN